MSDNKVNMAVDLVKAFKEGLLKLEGSRITLPKNEIKDIIKVIKSLENRRVLLKGTTKRIISQEKRLLSFLGPLPELGYL